MLICFDYEAKKVKIIISTLLLNKKIYNIKRGSSLLLTVPQPQLMSLISDHLNDLELERSIISLNNAS